MKKILMLIAGATVASSSVMAASEPTNESGVYLGANYGYLKVDSEDDFDDDKDAIQGLIGYRFNNYIAVEGSVIDFGSYGEKLAKASTDGYTFAVKGSLPLAERFGLYVKLGQLWSETDYKVAGFKGSDDDDALFYGGGASFNLTENLVLNAEYIVYDIDLNADKVSEDVDDTDFETDFEHASLGLEYRF
ncbi:MAG: porin family protein [Spongiibacteraceae bacterium]